MKAQPAKQRTKDTPALPKGTRAKKHSLAETALPNAQPTFVDLHARITVRAYYLYVERGHREGYAEQDWLDAEHEILNQTFPV